MPGVANACGARAISYRTGAAACRLASIPARAAYWAMIVCVMDGWMVQAYANVPAFRNVTSCDWP